MLVNPPTLSTVTFSDLLDGEYSEHTISGFRLSLGNNYTIGHFASALFENEQGLAVVDLIYSSGISLEDLIIFEYLGSYGKHVDTFAMCDLMDYLRPEYNRFYA
ncbi:hypothetical protein EKK58_11100 [Candidatus Dependentiae bacterium]|nr:MAG: hypothetical protein EKK58_11100 [Candidatus Dependentiae bacterium]